MGRARQKSLPFAQSCKTLFIAKLVHPSAGKGDSEGDLRIDNRGKPALAHSDENGAAHVLLSETTGFTKGLDEGPH